MWRCKVDLVSFHWSASQLKFVYFEKATKLFEIFALLLFTVSKYIQTKVRWRFRKILWPSQNIWTLPGLSWLDLFSILTFAPSMHALYKKEGTSDFLGRKVVNFENRCPIYALFDIKSWMRNSINENNLSLKFATEKARFSCFFSFTSFNYQYHSLKRYHVNSNWNLIRTLIDSSIISNRLWHVIGNWLFHICVSCCFFNEKKQSLPFHLTIM